MLRRTRAPRAGCADELLTLMHGSDPVKIELNRLENEVRDKDRELGEAQAEIKALWLSERACFAIMSCEVEFPTSVQ